MKHSNVRPLFVFGAILAAALAAPLAGAADAGLTLPAAIKQALAQGPDLATSLANLKAAQDDLADKDADPATLLPQLVQARQAVALETANLGAKRIEVMGNVITNHLALYEAQENLELASAQLALDTRTLEIAKAKLSTRTGTALEVSRAESRLAGTQQDLANARAQLPILSNRLEPLLGLPLSASLTAAPPPAMREAKLDAKALEQNLESRLPGVLQAVQGVELGELNVRIADNDYTPPAQLRTARTQLENAKRALETTRKAAATQLKDALQGVTNALERVRIARKDLGNAEETLSQDRGRAKTGTIARVQLQTSELEAARARFALAQASDAHWRALAQLSSASGLDQTGLVNP